MKRKFFVIFMVLIFVFRYVTVPLYATENMVNEKIYNEDEAEIVSEISDIISPQATLYINQKFDNIKKIAYSMKEDFNLSGNGDNLLLGTPFVIYDADKNQQEEEFFYPVIDIITDKVVLVINVLGTTTGWQHSISTEYVEALNAVNWPKNNCVFFEKNDKVSIKVEDPDVVEGGIVEKVSSQELERVGEQITSSIFLHKIGVEENKDSFKNIPTAYIPTVTDELGSYYCNLENAQSQNFLPICWAASVATVVNYVNGTNITATQVCDSINHSYTGGYPADCKAALKRYGLNYKYRERELYFKTVVANIQRRKPILINAYGTNDNGEAAGHTVTVYGYKDFSGTDDYMILWDSNVLNAYGENVGGVKVISYNGANTTFDSANIHFTWRTSLSFK